MILMGLWENFSVYRLHVSCVPLVGHSLLKKKRHQYHLKKLVAWIFCQYFPIFFIFFEGIVVGRDHTQAGGHVWKVWRRFQICTRSQTARCTMHYELRTLKCILWTRNCELCTMHSAVQGKWFQICTRSPRPAFTQTALKMHLLGTKIQKIRESRIQKYKNTKIL